MSDDKGHVLATVYREVLLRDGDPLAQSRAAIATIAWLFASAVDPTSAGDPDAIDRISRRLIEGIAESLALESVADLPRREEPA